MLSTIRPRLDVEKSKVRKKIFGEGASPAKLGRSGPKYMTVGWVILTVPRRNSVSQAVVADMANARTAMETVMGSGIAVVQ